MEKIVKIMKTIIKKMLRPTFWKTYLAALFISIMISFIVGISTSSIWIGLLSYLATNTLLSFGVFYKFSTDAEKL